MIMEDKGLRMSPRKMYSFNLMCDKQTSETVPTGVHVYFWVAYMGKGTFAWMFCKLRNLR